MKKKKKFFSALLRFIAFMVVVFLLSLLLTKVLWSWTVPDLFSGAVEEGLIAGEISWYTAMKLALFIALLSGFTSAFRFKKS